MSNISRRIIQKLIISTYKKHYQANAKVVNKSIKKILKSNSLLLIFIFALSTTSCKDDKGSQKKDASIEKIEIKEDSAPKKDQKVILFYGNSLTAGYGLDPSESFPSNIENIIDSLDYDYAVVNAGLSGETTSGGLNRLDWVMNQRVDIFVLELGANDMLRGLPLEQTKENLSKIIDEVKAKDNSIKIVLCEMMAAPNMGADYVKNFQNIYKELANQNGVTFLPFFLNGVADNADLLLQDGKHPNAEGQKIVAQNIWTTLKTIL